MAVRGYGSGLTSRPPVFYVIAATVVLFLFLLLVHPFSDLSYNNDEQLPDHLITADQSSPEKSNEETTNDSAPPTPTWEPIPNLVHFSFMLPEPDSQFPFQFKHFLSVYAVWLHWHPETIFLHTNANREQVEAARNGTLGQWNERIFNMPGFMVNQVPMPEFAGNGLEIKLIEHKSDFSRVDVVEEIGGAYLDWDAFALRDAKKIREAGFNAVVGRQPEGQIMSGAFMNVPRAKCMSMWRTEMNRVFDGEWTTHSNDALDRIAKRLAREEGEVLIMEHEAFGPGSFSNINRILYEVHDDVPSNLENVTDGDKLQVFDEGLTDRWEFPERFPEWERDYSNTYLLHAFNLKGHGELTVRYILERRSDFARALYPVAKHMYDAGLIGIDD